MFFRNPGQILVCSARQTGGLTAFVSHGSAGRFRPRVLLGPVPGREALFLACSSRLLAVPSRGGETISPVSSTRVLTRSRGLNSSTNHCPETHPKHHRTGAQGFNARVSEAQTFSPWRSPVWYMLKLLGQPCTSEPLPSPRRDTGRVVATSRPFFARHPHSTGLSGARGDELGGPCGRYSCLRRKGPCLSPPGHGDLFGLFPPSVLEVAPAQ